MTAHKRRIDGVVSAAEAQQILSRHRAAAMDRATVIRWGREGRLRIVYQLPGKNGAILFDRASVDALAAELAAELDTDSATA